jgi:LysR family transcriptional regulator, transcriptional activator for bauABCD operon
MSLDRPCKNALPLVYQPHCFIERALGAYGFEREPDACRLEFIGILIATGSYGGLLPEHYAQLGAKRHPLAELPKSPATITSPPLPRPPGR